MACGKQHAGHSEHTIDAARPQLVQTITDDWGGKFEIAEFDRVLRQALFQMPGQHGKFTHRRGIAAAMSTQHHAKFFAHVLPSKCSAVRKRVRPEGSSV